MTDLTIPLPQRLRTVSSMIHMGEKIAWGSETALMDEAADALEATSRENADLRLAMLEAYRLISEGEIFEATAILKLNAESTGHADS